MKIIVFSSVSSQLNHLATSLARQKCLSAYVHSFLSAGRWWEKMLSLLPLVGFKIEKELKRRPKPDELDAAHIVQPAVALEFLIAAIARTFPARSRFLYRLRDIRGRILSRCGAKLVRHVDAVVAFHDTALEAFEAASYMGILRVLDFPSAHPYFTDNLVREESALCPNFASSLVINRPDFHMRRMEQEIALADFILVPSGYVAQTFSLSGVPSHKIVKIPYGADVSRFSPLNVEKHTKDFQVLFVGRLEQLKGLSYLLEGYRKFHKPDTTLVLAGALPPKPAVLKPYKGLFRYAGYIHPANMPDFYRQGSVFLLPSLIEGLPLVVLEAMASGLPVIVTDTGAADIVRDGIDGFVIPIRNSNAIANRLEALYCYPALRRKMGEQARRRALEFTWDRYGNEVTKFLTSHLTSKRS